MSPASTLQEVEATSAPARRRAGPKSRYARRKPGRAAAREISRVRKPDDMSLDEWQRELLA
jgi:hypothetical protein